MTCTNKHYWHSNILLKITKARVKTMSSQHIFLQSKPLKRCQKLSASTKTISRNNLSAVRRVCGRVSYSLALSFVQLSAPACATRPMPEWNTNTWNYLHTWSRCTASILRKRLSKYFVASSPAIHKFISHGCFAPRAQRGANFFRRCEFRRVSRAHAYVARLLSRSTEIVAEIITRHPLCQMNFTRARTDANETENTNLSHPLIEWIIVNYRLLLFSDKQHVI